MTDNLPTPKSEEGETPGRRDGRSTSTNTSETLEGNDQAEEKLQNNISEEDEGEDDQVSNAGSVHQVQGNPLHLSPFSHRNSTDQQQNDASKAPIAPLDLSAQPSLTTPTPPTATPGPKSSENRETASAPKQKETLFNIRSIILIVFWGLLPISLAYWYYSLRSTNTNPSKLSKIKEENWRQYVDPKRVLPNTLRSNIFASLKPVSASAVDEKTVATLLILSENEEKAAAIGRCLLSIVNSEPDRNGLSPEIDFQNDATTKLDIDNRLLKLLKPDETIIGVLIRNIDNLSSKHSLERARLLFAYCDGENPKVPNRLIIMTASADGELRQKFASKWVNANDFVDPLMARISGNTITISSDQQSIC